MPVILQPRGDLGVDIRFLTGQHQQLLDAMALHGLIKDPFHLLRRVEVRLVGRERAVLAVAAARPRERQREVAAERDAAAHSPR